jgi:hypothetical protein
MIRGRWLDEGGSLHPVLGLVHGGLARYSD